MIEVCAECGGAHFTRESGAPLWPANIATLQYRPDVCFVFLGKLVKFSRFSELSHAPSLDLWFFLRSGEVASRKLGYLLQSGESCQYGWLGRQRSHLM